MPGFELTGATPKCHGSSTQRVVEPGETLARVLPHLGAMGITRVAVLTGLDDIGIDTVAVTRPNSRGVSVAQGKGSSLVAAKVSGIMEAVEHYHAERITRPLVLATLAELSIERRAVDVAQLPRFVQAFHPDRRILWIEGSELRSGVNLWVPFDLVHLDFSLPLPDGSGCFLMGSSGLASGNHRLEAACHGIYELIERDAVTLFYRRGAEEQWRRRVDPASVDDPSCLGLLARYAAADVDVAIWDATTDIGVACFLCSVIDRRSNPFRPVGAATGAGCHLSRGVALARALSEAAQSRLTRIAGARDDLQASQLDQLRSLEARERSRAQMGPSGFPQRSFASVPEGALDTFEADIERLYARLERAGLQQVIGVDLSLCRFPVHVVRMIIPGLEGFSEIPGYQPGARARALSEVTAR